MIQNVINMPNKNNTNMSWNLKNAPLAVINNRRIDIRYDSDDDVEYIGTCTVDNVGEYTIGNTLTLQRKGMLSSKIEFIKYFN